MMRLANAGRVLTRLLRVRAMAEMMSGVGEVKSVVMASSRSLFASSSRTPIRRNG